MSLKKYLRGRRVQATRRRGAVILVKLARQHAGDKPQWIAVSPETYSRELIINTSSPPGDDHPKGENSSIHEFG